MADDLVTRLCCLLASYEMDGPHDAEEADPLYPDITPEKFRAMLDEPCNDYSCPHCFATGLKFKAEWLAARLGGKP